MSSNNGPIESRISNGEEAPSRPDAGRTDPGPASTSYAIQPGLVDGATERGTTQESAMVIPMPYPSFSDGQSGETNPARASMPAPPPRRAWIPSPSPPSAATRDHMANALVRATNALILAPLASRVYGHQAGPRNPVQDWMPPPPPRRPLARYTNAQILAASSPSLNGHQSERVSPARAWRPPPPPRAPRFNTTERIIGATTALNEEIRLGLLTTEGSFPRAPSPADFYE